jgi:hypothetical protein
MNEAINKGIAEKEFLLEKLETERLQLSIEKNNLGRQLAELDISPNQRYQRKANLPPELIKQRKELASKYTHIESRLASIKVQKRELRGPSEDYTFIRTILTETFGTEFKIKLFAEVGRRNRGEPPIKVSAPHTATKSYKAELMQLYNRLIEARKKINNFIDGNEPEINKAEYFQKMAPLSKCLPSLQDLQKEVQALTKQSP